MNDNTTDDLHVAFKSTSASYTITTLGLDEETTVFGHLGTFLSFITPHDLPVDVLRDAVISKVSLLQLILEALKVESSFICLVGIFFLISLLPFCFTLGWCCSRTKSDNSPCHIDSLMACDESVEDDVNCTIRGLFIFLQVIVVCLIACVIAMFVTNEQISSAVDKTPNMVRTSLKDLELYLRDSNSQIVTTLNEGLTSASERVKADLEDIDKLLGEPIQKELSSDTGIEVVFESVINICTINMEITQRIQLLRASLSRAIQMSQQATLKIEELQTQMSSLLRHCSYRDRPLCDTLRMKSFDEMGVMGAFRRLQTDSQILKMMRLGETEIDGAWRNLSTELNTARSKFRSYPLQIEEDTARNRVEIVRELYSMKDVAQISTRTLTSTVESLIDRINNFWSDLGGAFDKYHEAGNLMWAFSLGTSFLIIFVVLLLLGALSCGCCHAESKAGLMLVVCGIIISLASVVVGIYSISFMLIGGHGEVFACRPMYDKPKYTILERLFDRPGLIYEQTTTNGIIDFLLRPPGPDIDPFTTTLSSILVNCENNCTTYPTFELERLVNITDLTDLKQFPGLEESFENLSINEYKLHQITKNLQVILQTMLLDSSINLTEYRYEISHPTPEKDIATFSDQLQRVSLQIQDVATASRMTTLGSRARRVQTMTLQPLEQLRGDVLYHLTALELQTVPWRRQVNQTLFHLETVHYFLMQNSHETCANRSRIYIQRLKNHLETNQRYTTAALNSSVAPCRPLYQLFNAYRSLLCQQTIRPLNGLWFIAFCCLTLWTISTPLILLLASSYRKVKNIRRMRHSNSHQTPSEHLIISEQSNWGSTDIGAARTVDAGLSSTELDRSNWKIYIIDPNEDDGVEGDVGDDQKKSKLDDLGITYIYFNDDLVSEYLI